MISRHLKLIFAVVLFLLGLLFMAVTVYGQPTIPVALIAPQPDTNRYHIKWIWDGGLTNRYAIFLNSNGMAVRYVETTNLTCTFSNLIKGPTWTAELYSVGNGAGVSWQYTNYVRALFSTNVIGPWAELPQTTWPYPPASGFLRWTNFDNLVMGRD